MAGFACELPLLPIPSQKLSIFRVLRYTQAFLCHFCIVCLFLWFDVFCLACLPDLLLNLVVSRNTTGTFVLLFSFFSY